MSDLNAAINAARSALTLDQTMIGITGNNIANLDNPDFARRQASMSEQTPVDFGRFSIGTGVKVDKIIGVRDAALNLRIAAETSDTEGQNAFVSAMQQAEQYFPADGSSGIAAALNQFWSAWRALSSDPSGDGSKQQVFSAAQTLVASFHQVASGISGLAAGLNKTASEQVAQANDLLRELAQMNASSNPPTPETEDAQDHAIGELSKLLNVSVIRNNGMLQITTASGVPLVSATSAVSLQTSEAAGQLNILADGVDVTPDCSSGAVGGNLECLNSALPNLQSRLDALASGIAQSVNGAYGSSFFSPGNAMNIGLALSGATQVQAGNPTLPGDNAVAQAVSALDSEPVVGAQSAAAYHADTVFQLGEQIAQATAERDAGRQILAQMNQQRQSIEGVSLDKEAANLMQFQRAYSAAARVITAVDQMMQTVISMGANA